MLELEPTPDILAELARDKGDRRSWWALPRRRITLRNTRGKNLRRKGADMIVANDVTQEGAGFDTDTNIVTLFLRDGSENWRCRECRRSTWPNRILDRVAGIAPSGAT